jgi:uncharacterized protein (TIGR03382 family)
MRTAVLVSLLLFSIPGCRADRDKCAKATQHFAELVFWDRENARIAKLPPAQQDAARKRKLVEFQHELDAQLDVTISKCVAAGNDAQADCINESKTAAEALKCADIAKGPESSHGCCDVGGGSPAGSAVLAALLALALGRRRRVTG